MIRTITRILAATPLVLGTVAATIQARDEGSHTVDDEALHIPEVFSSHLPTTQRRNTVRVSIHPHLGDITRRDELRISTGLRYGLSHRWEAGIATDFYFSHGCGDTRFGENVGLADIRLSTKWNVGRFPTRAWSSAVGLDFARPIGSPPRDLTDGLQHIAPYATFSRRLDAHPMVRIFWGSGIDVVHSVGIAGSLGPGELDDDSVFATGGFVIDRGRLHYTFEAKAATSRVIGGSNQESLTLRPGVIWEIPWGEDSRWGSKWLVGGSLRATFGPHDTSIGGGMKLRVEFDPKQWRRNRERIPGPPDNTALR